jgi:hypothetical protein
MDGGQLPEVIDMSTGFTEVYREVVTTRVIPNASPTNSAPMNTEILLSRSIALAAGSYGVVLGFRWSDLGILTVRFWGQESGTRVEGGKGGGLTKVCSYTPSADSYPEGRAYMGSGIQHWNGDPSSSVGFGSRFTPATAKVTACVVRGEWGNDIFNPGDLDLAFVSTR